MKALQFIRLALLISLSLVLNSCNRNKGENTARRNGGLTLPQDFEAQIVADTLGHGRHIAVNSNGDIYLALQDLKDGHGLVALRDTNGDGVCDRKVYFGNLPGTGLQIHKGYLYFAHDTGVIRYKLRENELLPGPDPEPIVVGFKRQYQHAAKTIAFDQSGNLYVNVGAPSNACQVNDRTAGSPGMDPCPLLETHGGIWKFRDDVLNQTQEKDGHRFVTGLRNCVALDWNNAVNKLYVVQHGRDQLNQMFPKYYDNKANANLPAEEFFMLEEGDDCGWPYCYFDDAKNKKVLAPEYGGNGDSVGRCAFKKNPFMSFPAHTAPNDLLFYNQDMFPVHYKNGAFIAFHGSWNRAPLIQEGFNVIFVPFNTTLPAGAWEIFASGFAGKDTIKNPDEALHRPMGLATGSDGSLYISDSQKGTIWRITYKKRNP
jgi:glucose/arabinose dehydrogenase